MTCGSSPLRFWVLIIRLLYLNSGPAWPSRHQVIIAEKLGRIIEVLFLGGHEVSIVCTYRPDTFG